MRRNVTHHLLTVLALGPLTVLLPAADAFAAVAAGQRSGVGDLVRFQDVSDVPTDLPADDAAADPLDAPADVELLDEPQGDDPLDAEVVDDVQIDDELVDEEPLDGEPLVDTGPDPLDAETETVAVIEPEPVAVTTTKTVAVPVATGPVLPPDFGRGQTVVLNPPAGFEVEAPTDCKYLLEHGRAVVGIGCGDDAGPWWLSQVGAVAAPVYVAPVPVATAPVATFPVTTVASAPAAPVPATLGGSAAIIVSTPSRTLGDAADLVPTRAVTENGRRRLVVLDDSSVPRSSTTFAQNGRAPRLGGSPAASPTRANREARDTGVRAARQIAIGDQPARAARAQRPRTQSPKRIVATLRQAETKNACQQLRQLRTKEQPSRARLANLKQRCEVLRAGRD